MDKNAPSPRKAAQYLRMSSDQQVYSLENQRAAIASYAADRGLEIVRTYRDAGVSGLSIKGRAGLRQLLADVARGEAGFDTILVYDISRWGRFQDPDESAHYEFFCRKAGVGVEYCAEGLGIGGVTADVLKQLKRVMAAEYSRKLSDLVAGAQRRLAGEGQWQGGPAPYALRRCELDARGVIVRILKPGELKSNASHKVVLAPGPAGEQATVREVYRLFLEERVTRTAIVRRLNRDGPARADGHAWTYQHVRQILTHPAYAGDFVFGRTRQRLQGPSQRQPADHWVVRRGALRGVVSREDQARAAKLIAAKTVLMDDRAMLEGLRRLWRDKGRLTSAIINAAQNLPTAQTYGNRFGGLSRAYELIGYVPSRRRRSS